MHRLGNVALSFLVQLWLQFLCLSFGRVLCSWPTNGGAVALRNGGDPFTAPRLMQKEELARHMPALDCRAAEGTLLSVRWMPLEKRNALELKRLKIFLEGSCVEKWGLKYAPNPIILIFRSCHKLELNVAHDFFF